ncbi:hypothetical protein CR513_07266, partial [Mucuna pruriens]
MNIDRHEKHGKDTKHIEVKALQRSMTRGELKRLEEEVQQKMSLIHSQFLGNLNNCAKLYYYTSLANLVHQATKVELQLKRRQASKKSYPSCSWKGKDKERERSRKDKSPKNGNGHISSQCPNRRTMVLRNDGHIESGSSYEGSSSSNKVEYSSDSSHYEGDLLMESSPRCLPTPTLVADSVSRSQVQDVCQLPSIRIPPGIKD